MSSRSERFLIALVFALVAAGVTLVVASAQDGAPPPAQGSGFSTDCTVCHTEFQMTWESGAQGQAGSDPVFVEEWTKQGKPGACLVCHTTGYDPATATYKADGVTCEACHGEANGDHPKSPMTIDRSPDLCGRCHSDKRFGWQLDSEHPLPARHGLHHLPRSAQRLPEEIAWPGRRRTHKR